MSPMLSIQVHVQASSCATTSGPALRVPSPPSSPLGAREDGISGRKLSNKEKKRLQKAQRRAERQTLGFSDIYGPEAGPSILLCTKHASGTMFLSTVVAPILQRIKTRKGWYNSRYFVSLPCALCSEIGLLLSGTCVEEQT